MKVLMINTNDLEGGAARATFRFHQEIRKAGVDSTLVVQSKNSDHDHILSPSGKFGKGFSYLRPTIDQIPLLFYGKSRYPFSPAWFPFSQIPRHLVAATDLVHLNWINKGFLSIDTIRKIKKPLVWTLHDMWPLTGGCHYSMTCERFQSICGPCPQLNRSHTYDVSHWVWKWKSLAWRKLPITFICPSNWMANNVRKSSLFSNHKIEVLAYGLDLNMFHPGDQVVARKRLGLPLDKTLILFSAIHAPNNPFKGFNFLEEVIARLIDLEWKDRLELVIMGSSKTKEDQSFKIPVHYLGNFRDELSISFIYNAVDLFIAPSVIDNLPNTILEAFACGIPCVSFNVGGISDQIKPDYNGYLATPYEICDLTFGIHKILKNKENRSRLSLNARLTAEESYDIKKQSKLLINLYKELIDI